MWNLNNNITVEDPKFKNGHIYPPSILKWLKALFVDFHCVSPDQHIILINFSVLSQNKSSLNLQHPSFFQTFRRLGFHLNFQKKYGLILFWRYTELFCASHTKIRRTGTALINDIRDYGMNVNYLNIVHYTQSYMVIGLKKHNENIILKNVIYVFHKNNKGIKILFYQIFVDIR